MKNKLFTVFLLFMVIIPVTYAQLVPRDFLIEVSKGNVPGHSIERLSGINPAVGNTYEDIISAGGNYVYPTVAVLVNVSSTDVDDTAGGSGVWNVTIDGLDANWNLISETILLNGQTNVTSTEAYLRINHVHTRGSGASNWNEGVISITSGAMLLSQIPANHGEDQYAIYSVPVNYSVIPFTGFLTSSEDKTVEFELQTMLYGESWHTSIEVFSFRSNTIFDVRGFKPITGMTDIKIRGIVGATTGEMGATLKMLLISDDVIHNSTLLWSDGTIGTVTMNNPAGNTTLYLILFVVLIAVIALRSKS